jgi:uncharacterized membrane protein YphA (DoxX/SURF4 family)
MATCDFLPQRFLVILRTLLLGGGGLLLLFGSEAVGFAGAGPLGCVVTAFVANWGWKAEGWTDETVSSAAHIMTRIYIYTHRLITREYARLREVTLNKDISVRVD